MNREYELKLVQEYNEACSRILQSEREKRKISLEELSYGMLSRTALAKLEAGKSGWTKLTGDTLMQRMGVVTDYFEEAASAEEMDRWRRREDICLMVPAAPLEAVEKIQQYRQKYEIREPIEEQFLIKAEVLLLLLGQRREKEPEEILKMAEKAVFCTIPDGWRGRLDRLWLAPAELEALLLAAAALAACGRGDEAWSLWRFVWNYPEMRSWGDRMRALIEPQAAIVGIRLAQGRGDNRTAFNLGKEALELLRRNCCQCYVLLLLECLCGAAVCDGLRRGEEERNYLRKAIAFRNTFRKIYRQFKYPEYRIWQGIAVDNTREMGMMLKMLRQFEGKSVQKAVYDGEEMVVTTRQLEKIEKGVHKPSYAHFQRLIKQYGKAGVWKMPMLETDSAEVLKLRQEIATMIGFGKWEEAEWKIEKLRSSVDADYPRVRQELLFFDALYKWKREDAMEEGLAMLIKALHYTVPDLEGRDMKLWVFQREEIMIASNIADIYRILGQLDESAKWFEDVKLSLERQRERTGVPHNGYDILMDGYDNLLGDTECFNEALEMNKETIQNYLKWPQIRCMASMFYRIAWNTYEIADKKTPEYEAYRQQWKNAFQICESLADFIYDSRLVAFLQLRKNKFLC